MTHTFICRFYDLLFDRIDKNNLKVLTLHSNITLDPDEAKKIFQKLRDGKRKVILSTNIAESSITVPDVRYVIDFCLTKNLFCDPNTSYPSLRLEWASKSSCNQRRGRAGRVSNGRCYRMVPRGFFEGLDEHAPPEMQRAPLQQLILKTKLLDMGDPKTLLGLAISPPNLDDIERTILCLKEVLALTNAPTKEKEKPRFHPRFDGTLTFVGRVMAQLPLDVHLTKLILLGHVFGVLEDAIIMAAALNHGGFFSRPFRKDIEAFMAQLSWTNETNSDVIGLLNAYKAWRRVKNAGGLRTYEMAKKWGKENFIDMNRIIEVEKLVTELSKRLERINILPTPPSAPSGDSEHDVTMSRIHEEECILKFIIAGAFYPNYFIRQARDEHESLKELCGLNPFTTVMLSGVPSDQGPLYKDQINAVFQKHLPTVQCETKYHFENKKVFVEFVPAPGIYARSKIPPHVYLALKMAKINVLFQFEGMSKDEAAFKMVCGSGVLVVVCFFSGGGINSGLVR